jgi:succinyl-diaminopimelate desuccinylase
MVAKRSARQEGRRQSRLEVTAMARVEIDADAATSFLRDLVQQRSVFDPEAGTNEHGAAMLVAERMRALGWSPVVEEVEPGRPNVVAVIDGGRPGPTLLFEGHTDVVTAGDDEAWERPPFAAQIADGRLHGRGAADMKSGVVAMILATAAVAEQGPFPGRIVVAALVDEEGLMKGVKHFAHQPLAAEVDAAIVCEPEGGEICTSQKGAIRLRISVTGQMAHGAMPDKGVNPIPPLAEIVRRMALLEEDLHGAYGRHPHLGTAFVTPTVTHAGSIPQLNVIPSDATVGVDIRTIPGIDHPQLIARIREECAQIAEGSDTTIDIEVIDDRPATQTGDDEPIVRAVVAAHREVTGEEPHMGGVPGTTDGTILWRDAGIPIVTYGPGGKWIAHQANEFVELDEVVLYAQVYAEAAQRFLASAGAARTRLAVGKTY